MVKHQLVYRVISLIFSCFLATGIPVPSKNELLFLKELCNYYQGCTAEQEKGKLRCAAEMDEYPEISSEEEVHY